MQHTSGLGQPDHIISVNTDPHCPMMQLADLAVVADANAVLDELLRLPRLTGPSHEMAEADFDVVVVGAGPAGSLRGARRWPAPGSARCCSSAGRSPAARTCTAAWSTRASSTS